MYHKTHRDDVPAHPPPNEVCYKSIAAMTRYPAENKHETTSRRTTDLMLARLDSSAEMGNTPKQNSNE